MKKILAITISILVTLTFFGGNKLYAFEEVLIPETMQPNTVIEYVSDTEYAIIVGGKSKQRNKNSKIKQTLQNDLLKDKIIDESNYKVEKMPKPIKGMKVTYATDGKVLNIIVPDQKTIEYTEVEVFSKQPKTSLPPLPPINLKVIATWGSNSNTLYRGLGKIWGVGRATTFSDTIGQANHRLVKGDVATKLAYDNCKVGTKLEVSHKNKKRTMTKWDAGGMPNAVLDIWKTGVEYFGYKWSSSFSLPGNVLYTHPL